MYVDKGHVTEICAAAEARLRRLTPKRFCRIRQAGDRSGSLLEAMLAASYYFKTPVQRAEAHDAIRVLAAFIRAQWLGFTSMSRRTT